ncbi:hypothetical protein ACK3SF_03105 [Candidatus Nanosalina sp. VS9-1]|uniref:hypothetical protein n=1 Tax=Candidatus Nanosalina sp. VS9-1 TaxID=3388566 RepID=UPI0039E1D9B5
MSVIELLSDFTEFIEDPNRMKYIQGAIIGFILVATVFNFVGVKGEIVTDGGEYKLDTSANGEEVLHCKEIPLGLFDVSRELVCSKNDKDIGEDGLIDHDYSVESNLVIKKSGTSEQVHADISNGKSVSLEQFNVKLERVSEESMTVSVALSNNPTIVMWNVSMLFGLFGFFIIVMRFVQWRNSQ